MFSVRALTNSMRSGAIRCSSIPKRGLDEFFPIQSITEKNTKTTPNDKSSEAKGIPATVGTERIKVGGDWKAWMLRLKSSDDLHKLWYVLLKERNALLTERAICRSKNIPFPDPTRRKKVQKSMARIKLVLHERSQIYKSNQAEIANNKTTTD
uniref:Large ribosomal subunit protein uL29m n=1 Tax=Albugo laibachii Nc14 TaxID=890382 RepID=F0WHU9_9STRA|nr:mitochondrial 39S ribosomal protein L47 putative [Albugo laibachii Nc14]|eukprot:CCA20824.1 mitochondrial 39S ribosomal protein L47 putative [Albugo laibachii Nc14]